MNYYQKILCACLTYVLFVNELHFVDSGDIGDGSMNYEDFDRCYRTVTCFLGFEVYLESKTCYELLTEENYLEAVGIAREAAEESNLTLESDNLDDQRNEYCAYTEDGKRAVYEHITGKLVDKFTAICSSRSKRRQCSNFEIFLDCGFTLMEKYAAEGKCIVPDGFKRR
ncbi:uncharacterized protein NPIL_600661 [Nephila pilipes]|uniref:Uncharacterized protein n=1 Tax=Nephila pilipes TaxID=299642 RepID=A0A8X6NAU9_NEPPI|nr:uncharacterized protein NPIL_600661 [Nephila pilipes]